ncbi:hypothetical protein AQUCO_01300348v1 [Aquilegia coerulea]|uniref:Uncharacterized protein n=1 Tax=Aquilegia coerulea TaxID=218851 RepID=A0A2G5E127_AQUCA|nr:hypothetical protein AQUCO_01300348v1 [Aquilegia coerulea]
MNMLMIMMMKKKKMKSLFKIQMSMCMSQERLKVSYGPRGESRTDQAQFGPKSTVGPGHRSKCLSRNFPNQSYRPRSSC